MDSILQHFEYSTDYELDRFVEITHHSQEDFLQKANDLQFEIMMRPGHGIDEDLYQRTQVCERKFLAYTELSRRLREEKDLVSPRKRARSQPRMSPNKVTFKDDE